MYGFIESYLIVTSSQASEQNLSQAWSALSLPGLNEAPFGVLSHLSTSTEDFEKAPQHPWSLRKARTKSLIQVLSIARGLLPHCFQIFRL